MLKTVFKALKPVADETFVGFFYGSLFIYIKVFLDMCVVT